MKITILLSVLLLSQISFGQEDSTSSENFEIPKYKHQIGLTFYSMGRNFDTKSILGERYNGDYPVYGLHINYRKNLKRAGFLQADFRFIPTKIFPLSYSSRNQDTVTITSYRIREENLFLPTVGRHFYLDKQNRFSLGGGVVAGWSKLEETFGFYGEVKEEFLATATDVPETYFSLGTLQEHRFEEYYKSRVGSIYNLYLGAEVTFGIQASITRKLGFCLNSSFQYVQALPIFATKKVESDYGFNAFEAANFRRLNGFMELQLTYNMY